MHYKNLGRLHTSRLFGFRMRLLTPVSMALGVFLSLLAQPSSSVLLLALCVGYLASRLIEVPLASGLCFHPLARRVSVDP